MISSRYTQIMDHKQTVVLETRRIYLVIVGLRCVLLWLGWLARLMWVYPEQVTIPWLSLTAMVIMAALALMPLDSRMWQWLLAFLLGLDMLLMSLRALPAIQAVDSLMPDWVLRTGQVAMVEPFLLMLIPLLLLSWAYGKRGAIYGTMWGGFLQVGGAAAYAYQYGTPLAYIVDAVGRTFLMFSISIIVSVLSSRQQRQIVELQEAQSRLRNHADTVEQLAVSRERNRMARDLHDTLAHSLAALTTQLQALRSAQQHDDLQVANRLTDEALETARSGLRESRQAIQALRTDPLTMLGLVGTIRGELRNLEARAGIHAELYVSGENIDLSAVEERTIWRVCQEALRNVERHSNASHVVVRLAYGPDEFMLTIEDDGPGFDPSSAGEGHYGLAGMREHAELVSGRLAIRSGGMQGTIVRLTIPRGGA